MSSPKPPETLAQPYVRIQKQDSETLNWHSATEQAWLDTGVMHAFRFSTEGRTRDTLNGPWFNDWMASVSEIRGWDEGGPFITDYVAPSMEGAIFGFIQKNNDPRHSQVEWGSGRDYSIRRLRGLSFSAVISTQWKIRPASEASLGNVQLQEYPGFGGLVARSRTTRYVATGLRNIKQTDLRWLGGGWVL